MQYNEIGKTGLKVSNLGFGASSLGGVFHGIKEEEAIAAVHAAVDGDINFIDVSPYYGHLKAETVLGKALKEIDRDKYILSTKVGRYGKDGVNFWDYSAKRAKESVYESMERLNIDYIDLINVHDVEFADLQPENLKWVIEHCEEGTVESILNFCHYCLNDNLLTEYFEFFESRGIGIINASPFSMGLLSMRGAPDWHPATETLREACAKAARYCDEQGYPIDKLAIQYSTSCNDHIATTLFSSANPKNVLKNIEYVNEPIDWQLVEKVKEIIGDQMGVRWRNS